MKFHDINGNTYLSSFSTQNMSNLDPTMHLNKLNNFRVLKNLGSRVTKVIVFDEEDHTGY